MIKTSLVFIWPKTSVVKVRDYRIEPGYIEALSRYWPLLKWIHYGDWNDKNEKKND